MKYLLHLLSVLTFVTGLTACSGNRSSEAEFSNSEPVSVTMYKNPGCECCTRWAQHLESNGFEVTEEPTSDMIAVKSKHDIPYDMESCHTAVIGDYVVEGHVPAEDVKDLLAEKPDARGVAVAGMPVGSPGMEMPGRSPEPYKVFLFKADGARQIYAQH